MEHMLVTTSYEPSMEVVTLSKQLAKDLNCRMIPRNKDSLNKLKEKYRMSGLWIVTNHKEIRYYNEGTEPVLFFHPSTALIRVKRLIRGEKDTLIECSGVMVGDSVLDCTAGMASDAIVFSYVTGPSSRIIALESEKILYLLLKEGLVRYESDSLPLNEAMRRIQMVQSNHYEYLLSLPDKSMDIVYFDPMFRNPLEDSSALSPMRAVANPQSLTIESIQAAKRVARKTVVLKEHRDSKEFDRLGFSKVYTTASKIAYGVIKL